MLEPLEKAQRRLQRERRSRQEAERLLEEKSDELYLSLQAVNSSRSMLQSTLDSMADGLLLLDANHHVVLSNEQLKKIYYYRQDSLIVGQSVLHHFKELIYHPEFVAVKQLQKKNTIFDLTYEDKRTISVSVGRTPEGYMATTHRDISRAKKLEQEKQKLTLDLFQSQRIQAIGRMSSMIAHDFNNIIASISGIGGFLQEDLKNDPEKLQLVDRIMASTGYAESLITQILDYGNKQKFHNRIVSVLPVLEDCVDMITHVLHLEATINFTPPEGPYWIEGNESRLSQLFTNLLSNANRALTHTIRQISITVEVHENFDLEELTHQHTRFSASLSVAQKTLGTVCFVQSCLVISITDTGEGMNQEVMDNVFDLYFTTRKDVSEGGVGMASVAEVITESGAGIKLFSQRLVGTQVVVVLPLIVVDELHLVKP